MRVFTILFFVLATMVATAGSLEAQVLFSENFSGGSIPATWGNADATPFNVKWEYCANPTAGCVDLYGRPVFAGSDAANGFVVLDSDAAGELTALHDSRLTTPAINCSTAPKVYVTFESSIGVFNHSADDLAILRVSTDNATWTDFQIFSGLGGTTAATRFSENPLVSGIDISSVAGGQSTVYIQWRWEGNFDYWWLLDNVVVTTQDPSPRNEIAVTDFFYPVSSYATPQSQIGTDTFGFFGRVSNKGSNDAKNVKLTAKVVEVVNQQVGATLYTDSKTIGTLPSGYADSLIILDGLFAPELGQGLYRIVYSVSSDSVDQRPANNEAFDNFEVTDFIFSKEVGPTGGFRPSAGGDYAVANIYTMSKNTLENYNAIGMEFTAVTNAGFAIENVVVAGFLFKVNDDILPNYSNFDDTELFSPSLELVGSGDFDFPTGAANYALQSFELLDFTTSNPGVPLKAGARYFATISYADDSNAAFHAFADRIDYRNFSTPVNVGGVWNLNGFGGDAAGVIRLYLELSTSVDEKALPDNALSIFPNPVSDMVRLKVDFATATDATITIAQLDGRVITYENREGLTNETLSYQLNLASGTYLARIATKEGTKTKKFVVLR